ncbi:hypothetical protein OESDEN_03698 [Oesophagostomum dentatum]|uniref:Uncharacterized protein n=1 Tax=Oesophagostomum dentatum TaxID=61180 RepID=A0A0B1TFJ9_OESDE|nr:hypothetical protein OESDEN_03698 [Oesophagostomum dentatum]
MFRNAYAITSEIRAMPLFDSRTSTAGYETTQAVGSLGVVRSTDYHNSEQLLYLTIAGSNLNGEVAVSTEGSSPSHQRKYRRCRSSGCGLDWRQYLYHSAISPRSATILRNEFTNPLFDDRSSNESAPEEPSSDPTALTYNNPLFVEENTHAAPFSGINVTYTNKFES